jgi:hypothetical protein
MFKIFAQKREHINLPMAVSIAPWGKVAFNRPASDLLKEKGIKTAVLLFDEENLVIGIRQPKGFNESEYKLSNSQHESYLVICPKAFLKFINWPLKKTRSFPVEWDEKENMLLVKLPNIWEG